MPEIEEGDPSEMTSPRELFEPERMERHQRRGDSAMSLAAKLRAERPDAYDLIAAMAFEFTSAKEQDRSANQELDKQFKSFLSQQPGGKEFEDLKRTVGLWKWIGTAFVIPALGSLVLALGALRSQAIHEGELNADIARLKSDVQQLLQQFFSGGPPPRHQPQGPTP